MDRNSHTNMLSGAPNAEDPTRAQMSDHNSQKHGPEQQTKGKKPLPLEKKLAAGVCLAFGLSLMITARTTKYLYKRLQQPPAAASHPPKLRLRQLKRPGASFQFLNNRTLLDETASAAATATATTTTTTTRPSLSGMMSFVADGWREEEKPQRPEDFNPAFDAAKALGIATAAVLGLFGSASGALLWWWGVTDLESFKLAMRSEMPSVLQSVKPTHVPEWARLPRSDPVNADQPPPQTSPSSTS